MTKEKVQEVAIYYEEYLHNHGRQGIIENHCKYILEQILTFIKQNNTEKAMRWLGFVQGCLWTCHYFTIDELRGHNRVEGKPHDSI
mgnify:FL=1